MDSVVKLDYFDFFEQFQPILNHLDSNASENGCMFETYGEELEFVKAQPSNKVWTVMTDDNGNVCIGDGFHHVNRLGYLVTEVPFEAGKEYYVE